MKKNWEIKTLGDVCEIKSGSTPLRSNKLFWENGNFPWFTIDDIREQGRIITNTKQNVTELALSKLTIYPIDTILLCCTASVGEYAITKIPITSNQQFNGLTIKDSSLLIPEFLFYYSSTLKDLLLEKSGKTTIDFVSQAKVKEIPIPIPPIKEQEEIVEKLDKGFELIDSLKETAKKNLDNAKELFQSVLREELSPKEGWETKKLGEVCEVINRGISPKYTEENGIKVINQKCIRNHEINFELVRLNDELHKKVPNERYIKYGDVLINSTGTGTLGRVAQIITKDIIATVDSHVTIVRPIKNKFFDMFFGYSLIYLEKEISEKGQGCGGQTELSRETVGLLTINYPISIKEQEEIVGRLDLIKGYCEELEGNYKRVLELCEELKQGLLREAFSY